jgi:methyltransferase (TIGR00027 family)
MFKSVRRISYSVYDIEEGKEWYNSVLKTTPFFESPLFVIYKSGEVSLSLVKGSDVPIQNENMPVVFWEVDDIDASYKNLLEKGAKPVAEISIYFKSRIAKVADPFGNIIGISCPEAPKSKSLDDRPSETAMTVAFCRALSFIEEDEALKGDDYMAEIFLNEESVKPLKDKASIVWVKKNVMTDGSYEFLISRTKYFDEVVKEALSDEIPQIVFLGAGYDSRVFRFEKMNKSSKIFELDVKSTQQRKIEMLKKANVAVPANLKFVEVDFTKERLIDCLIAAGYKREMKTLFIWEGVTYYLTQKDVDNTLEMVKSNSPAGSIITFDYVITAPDMATRYKAKEVAEKMRERYSAEPVQKGIIEEGKLGEYLSERGFNLVEHYTPEEMENKFILSKEGVPAGRITAIFCLAKAVVV